MQSQLNRLHDGGGMLETGKKVAMGNKGLGKSGKGGSWVENESKKKGRPKWGHSRNR